MDDHSKLILQNMIDKNNVLDQTPLIRELKHSNLLREEINKLIEIRNNYKNNKNENENDLNMECMLECNFLFTYYTDIYNKIKKDELNILLLFEFLDILKEIEEGVMDQHEASFKVGTILKELYVDSALKKSEKLDNQYNQQRELIKPNICISYQDYKKLQKNKK